MGFKLNVASYIRKTSYYKTNYYSINNKRTRTCRRTMIYHSTEYLIPWQYLFVRLDTGEILKYLSSYLQYLEHDLVDGEALLGSGPVPGGDLEEFRWLSVVTDRALFRLALGHSLSLRPSRDHSNTAWSKQCPALRRKREKPQRLTLSIGSNL